MSGLLLIIVLLFILGLAIGSFLSVVIYRLVHNDSPLRGRSYCDNCKKQIAWYDNIPLLSFILLRRKCRYCGHPIPWEYPAVEFLTGALFVWWFVVGFTFFRLSERPFLVVQPLFWLFVGILLVVIFFTDYLYYIIPDSAVLLLTLMTLVYRLFLTGTHIMMSHDFALAIACGIGASLFFLMLFLLTRGRGMGFGDVKLAFPLGLLLGWPNTLVALFLSFLIGASVGIVTIIDGKKKLKSAVPFGPFLVIGALIALLWGSQLVRMYMSLL